MKALRESAQFRRFGPQVVLERFEFLGEQAAQRAHRIVVAADRSECACVIEYRQLGSCSGARQRGSHP